MDTVTGEIYATHPLCLGKGELIGSSSHDNRDMSQSVKELDKSIKELFKDNPLTDTQKDFLLTASQGKFLLSITRKKKLRLYVQANVVEREMMGEE